ncbi:MAG: nucleotidyl transferase AbiEii/AbiGii toxin family protein [Candidatus Dormibacterales bacterium]
MALDLVGEREIAMRLGVKPGTVHQWRKRGLLPDPVAVVSAVPVWEWRVVFGWASATGRAGPQGRTVESSMVLPGGAAEVLDRLSRSSLARHFYLAGGTGMALQVGHRVSRDLDLFTSRQTETLPTRLVLDELGHLFRPPEYTVRLREATQLDLDIEGVKVSFLAYPFALEERLVRRGPFKVADARDIAAMKAYSIGRRAVSRDYVDLYYSLSSNLISMDRLCAKAERVFVLDARPVFDAWLFAKQLTYTDDLTDWRSVMDDVLDEDLTWEGVKRFLNEVSTRWLREHLIRESGTGGAR